MSNYVYRGKGGGEPTPIRGFDPSACGIAAGYRRHQKHGVPACQPCKDATAAYSRERRQAAPAEFRPDACGTWAGWHRHRYHGIPACDACKAAAREYQAQYRAARRAAREAAKSERRAA